MINSWTQRARKLQDVLERSTLLRGAFMAYSFLSLLFFAPAPALGSPPVAEIAPSSVTLGSGATTFTYDVLCDSASPADRIKVSVPGGFIAPSLLSVSANGSPAAYADETAGSQIAFLLASPAAAGAHLRISFLATPPSASPGIFSFSSTLDFIGDSLPPVSASAGDADGDAGDGNSLSVAADLKVDGAFGDWSPATRFLDQNDDGTPEKGDLRSGWFSMSADRSRIFARLDVDACLSGGQTTAFDVLMDTTGDGSYDYRSEMEIRGDGTILQKHLFRNNPPDANQSNDVEVSYGGTAATGQVPDNGCDQATEWTLPLSDLGNPAAVNLTHFESHPSGPSFAVADSFPDYGFIHADVSTGTLSHVGPSLNEIFLAASGGSQWIEIINSAGLPFSLSGMTLTDGDGSGNSNVTLPPVSMPAGAILVVHFGVGANDFDFTDGIGHFFTGSSAPVYAAEDQAALYSSATQSPATLIDFVAWDGDAVRSADFDADSADAVAAGLWIPGEAVDTAAMDPAQSLGRSGESLSHGLAADWETSGGRDAADPTPGHANVGGIVINEVLFSPLSGTPQGIELYNSGSGKVDLTGWMLSDSDSAVPGSGLRFSVPQLGGSDRQLVGHARLWIALGSGAEDVSTLFLPGGDPAALESGDQLSVYFRDEPVGSRLVDFVAWDFSASHSSDWLSDDDLATSSAIWNVGAPDDFVSVAALPAGHSILRTLDGVDTDRSQDWSVSLGQSQGDRDGDQDGLVDSRDNCAEVANLSQTDLDGDSMGDACDADIDGDGFSNGQDCSAGNPAAWSIPAAPANLRFTVGSTFLTDSVAQAGSYRAYRGSRTGAAGFAFNHACFFTSFTGSQFSDSEVPLKGAGYYYLVSGSNLCGESDLGSASSGTLRPNSAPCP